MDIEKVYGMMLLEACAAPVSAWSSMQSTVEALLKNPKVNVNYAHPINGYTPLHWAVKRRNRELARMLMASGSDPSLKAITPMINSVEMALLLDPVDRVMVGIVQGELTSFDDIPKDVFADTIDNAPAYIRNPLLTRELFSFQQHLANGSTPSVSTVRKPEIQPEKLETQKHDSENFKVADTIFAEIVVHWWDGQLLDTMHVVGSICVQQAFSQVTITDILKQCIEELDEMPDEITNLKVSKWTSAGVWAPVSSKQLLLTADRVLFSANSSCQIALSQKLK